MPTITFFQTKGGTGKTTSAFLLAEMLSRGNSVAVIDADPNHPFMEWKKDGGKGEKFDVITQTDDDKIPEEIYEASQKYAFVIVDTEGSANTTAARAAAMSDLVIVTSNGKPLDQKHAAKAIKFVKQTGKHAGREIPLSVLLTLQPAVGRSRTLKKAERDMEKHGIAVFSCQLINRDSFAAIFGYAKTLFQLDPKEVNEPHKGYFNARVYADEVVRLLAGLEKGQGATTGAKSDSPEEKASKEAA